MTKKSDENKLTTISSLRPSVHTLEHYATLRSYTSKRRRPHKTYYYLTLSPGVILALNLAHPSQQRCDIFWDEAEMQLLIKLNGTQRSVSTIVSRDYPDIIRARIALSSHVRSCEIPTHLNARLPVDIIDNNNTLLIDMEPPLIPKWKTETKTSRIDVAAQHTTKTNKAMVKANRIEPTLKAMFEEAARKEGMSLYVWSRESLLKYVEDMHPEIYHDEKYWVMGIMEHIESESKK